MKLVLIGIVGSGKSTQGNFLSKQLKIPYLSTGHIFRQIAKEKTTLGRKVKLIMTAGLLQPDELTVQVVEEYLQRPEYRHGYIIDGFPRTVTQVKKFKNNIDKVIYLDIPEKEALWRLTYRGDHSRPDDTIEGIKQRINVFNRQVQPVIKYYEKQGKLIAIDGTQTVKAVNKEILKNLGKQLIKNKVRDWEKKTKSIIAIVGLAGSGKSEASKFFSETKKLPIISFGSIVNEYIDEHELKHDEETHKKLREDLRVEHGMEAFAVLSKDKIEKVLQNNNIVVIDHLQSWEEYSYLKKTFPEIKIHLLALFADKRIRYKRISKRNYRSRLYGEERDINEIVGANKGPAIAFADFLVKNNFSREDFYEKLEQIYRAVYFS